MADGDPDADGQQDDPWAGRIQALARAIEEAEERKADDEDRSKHRLLQAICFVFCSKLMDIRSLRGGTLHRPLKSWHSPAIQLDHSSCGHLDLNSKATRCRWVCFWSRLFLCGGEPLLLGKS